MRIYGRNPVLERLKSNHKSIIKIFVEEDHQDKDYIKQKGKQWNIPVFVVPKLKMMKMGQHHNTQGVLMDVEEFPYSNWNDLLDSVVEKQTTLIFLDGLNDPQNLGGIIRTLASLGEFAIVLPRHESVEVTESVIRVASGGDNYIQIAIVSNINNAIADAKKKGYWIIGSVIEDGDSIYDAALPFPLALVVGSEQKGIREMTRKHLDTQLTIPMHINRMSLNVAHATAIFAYEITKQKNKIPQKKKSAAPRA